MDSTKGTPSLVLPLLTRILVKLISTLTDAASRRDGTVNRRLLNFLKYAVPANPNPIKGVSTFDITVDPNRNLWFRLFIPTVDPENKSLPVIVFYHGGGFSFLSPDVKNYDFVCRRFARKFPAIVVSVNYRLSPEHRYPAQIDDGYDVLKFIDDEMKGILPANADVTRCFLAGDSAGGNLAHHVALRAGESQFKKLKVIGLICIQPFFGGEERTEAEITLSGIDPLVSIDRTDWLWKGYLPSGQGMNRDHEVVNVSGPRAVDISQKEFPATLVVVAGFDSLKDWQKRYYEYLKKSGKEVKLLEYPTMIHAFYIFPELKESSELISEVNDFVHTVCSKL